MFLSCDKDAVEETPSSTCNFISYRYYRDVKDTIGELSTNYLYVSFDTTYSVTDIRKFISSRKEFDQNYKYTFYYDRTTALKFNTTKTCEEISGIINNLKQSPLINFAHFTMKTNNCLSMFSQPLGNLCAMSYGSLFNVMLHNENDLTDLHKMIAETNTELVEQNTFDKKWFILRATKKSKGDALAMANYFYESKRFFVAEPNLGWMPVE